MNKNFNIKFVDNFSLINISHIFHIVKNIYFNDLRKEFHFDGTI